MHKLQGVDKVVAKGAVSATFIVSSSLEGGGSGVRKQDKRGKQVKGRKPKKQQDEHRPEKGG